MAYNNRNVSSHNPGDLKSKIKALPKPYSLWRFQVESILAFSSVACSLAIHSFPAFWAHHSASVGMSPFVSIFSSVCLLQRYFSLNLESTQISQDYLKVLNLMKSAKAFVPNKETVTDSMDGLTCLLREEAPLVHYTQ